MFAGGCGRSLLELEGPDVLRPARAPRPLAPAPRVGVVTAHPVLAPVIVEFLFLKWYKLNLD